MQYSGLTAALTGMIALCMMGCGASKSVVRESAQLRIQGSTELTARDSVMVELRDTLKEVTTVTVQLNETGDTVKVSTVTDRTRASIRDMVKDVEVKTVVKTDTVYIERRDSVLVKSEELRVKSDRPSALVSALKWVFGILVCVIILIIVFKVKRWFHF